MIPTQIHALYDNLHRLLQQAKVYSSNGVSPRDEDFARCRSQVLDFFRTDAMQAINLLNALDLNDSVDAEIVDFFPDIVSNFRTFGERFLFISHIETLQAQYPNIDFSRALFFSRLNYHRDNNNSISDNPLTPIVLTPQK